MINKMIGGIIVGATVLSYICLACFSVLGIGLTVKIGQDLFFAKTNDRIDKQTLGRRPEAA